MLCLHTSDNVFKMRFKVSSCLQALITASISHLLLESSRQRSIKTQQGFNWKSSEIYFWWLLFLKAGQLYRSKIFYHRQINFFFFNICEWRNIAVMIWEVNKCHHLVNQPCFWLLHSAWLVELLIVVITIAIKSVILNSCPHKVLHWKYWGF